MKKKLPKESESQKLGQYAIKAVETCSPLGWRTKDLSGDDDVGYDFFIECQREGKYQTAFMVQLKSSAETDKSSERANHLSADGSFYSQSLKISTLNFFIDCGFPILLLFADLTQNPDPRKCNVYYTWLDDELNTLRQGQDNLDHLRKSSHTFRIPSANQLTVDTDVLPYLLEKRAFQKKTADLNAMLKKVVPNPIVEIEKLTDAYVKKPFMPEALTESADDPWIAAPASSIAKLLQNIDGYLTSNAWKQAQEKLDSLDKRHSEFTSHEIAEFWFLKGRLASRYGDGEQAHNCFVKAYNKEPNVKKYLIRYYDVELSQNADNEEKISAILADLPEDGVEFAWLRATAYLILRDFKAVKATLNGYEQHETVLLLAQIPFANGDYGKTITFCRSALEDPKLIKRYQFSLKWLAVHAFFRDVAKLAPDGIIAQTGASFFDPQSTIDIWPLVTELWMDAKSLGYPSELSIIAGETMIIAGYLNKVDEIYPFLVEYTEPINDPNIIALVLNWAHRRGDTKTTQKFNHKFANTPKLTVYGLIQHFDSNDFQAIVNLIEKAFHGLIADKPDNFDFALLIAAVAANQCLKIELRDRLLREIETLNNNDELRALYEFYNAEKNSVSNGQNPLDKLSEVYRSGIKGRYITQNLFANLLFVDNASSKLTIQLAEDLQRLRTLTHSDLLKLCQAHVNLKNWDELLNVTHAWLERSPQSTEAKALIACALDGKGKTSDAIEILEEILSAEDNFQALQIYSDIAIRCGLLPQAEGALLKFYPKASQSQKPRILDQLIHLKLGQNLAGDAKKYIVMLGELTDPMNEREEAHYLMTFMGARIQSQEEPSDEDLIAYHKRCDEFFNHYPDSKLFHRISMQKDAPREEILKQLEDIAGTSPEQKERYQKNQNMLKTGFPFPFALRPVLLQNVTDLYYLWNYSKLHGRRSPETQLTIDQNLEGWSAASSISLSSMPLFDDLTLLVLNDLGLLETVFSVFKKIAIPKTVFYRLKHGGAAFPGNGYKICADILEVLSGHLEKIEQPSLSCEGQPTITPDEILAYTALLSDNPSYIYYSDDVFSRFFVSKDNASKTMCTLDLLQILLESNRLTPEQVAEKKSMLTSWGVNGVQITVMDICVLALRNTSEEESFAKNLEALEQDKGFARIFGYGLNESQSFNQLLIVIGRTMAFLIRDNRFTRTPPMSILQAIWQYWFNIISILPKARNKIKNITLSYFSIASELMLTNDRTTTSSVLYSLYKDMLTTNTIEVEPAKALASMIGIYDNPQQRQAICDFSLDGIPSLSMDRERFTQTYVNTVASRTIRE